MDAGLIVLIVFVNLSFLILVFLLPYLKNKRIKNRCDELLENGDFLPLVNF